MHATCRSTSNNNTVQGQNSRDLREVPSCTESYHTYRRALRALTKLTVAHGRLSLERASADDKKQTQSIEGYSKIPAVPTVAEVHRLSRWTTVMMCHAGCRCGAHSTRMYKYCNRPWLSSASDSIQFTRASTYRGRKK